MLAGPAEASALGNVLVQARTLGVDLPDLAAMRAAAAYPGGAPLRAARRPRLGLRRGSAHVRRAGMMTRMRVALMVTCVNDAMFPETGKAVVTLLRRLGVDVEFPEAQTCCAQPMVNTGYLDEAVPVVRTFVDAFAGTTRS